MSTRSYLCKELPDGSYQGIYCHCDGYLTYNGAMLLDHYTTIEKVNALLELGDISTLREKVAPDPSLPHSFGYAESQEDVTVAYARDRGERKREARKITLEDAEKSDCDYMYVFGKDGRWRYYDLYMGESELRDVESDLNDEYERYGFPRPEGFYGFFTQSEIDRIRTEQEKMQKSEAVM